MDREGCHQSSAVGFDDRKPQGRRDNHQPDLDAKERVDTRMTITVSGDQLNELLSQLSVPRNRSQITIRFRSNDYERRMLHGCIIDARDFGEEVEKAFVSYNDALSYLRNLFNKRKKHVLAEERKRLQAQKPQRTKRG